MKRILSSLVALSVTLLPLPAFADDLDDLLEGAQSAEFEGEQMVSCTTPDGPRDLIFEVVQADGVVRFTASGGAEVVTADPGVSDMLTPGSDTGVYQVVVRQQMLYLGRAAAEYDVIDGRGFRRARMIFDHATGALLLSEVFNADGVRYCETRMIAFSSQVTTEVDRTTPSKLVAVDAGAVLPADLSDFGLRAAFEWEDGGVLGYYSDGLFSFTLLASEKPVRLQAGQVSTVPTENGEYRRWFGAGQVMYVWEYADGGYALLGDLPLDMQDAVLEELPDPWRPNLFRRFLRKWFG